MEAEFWTDTKAFFDWLAPIVQVVTSVVLAWVAIQLLQARKDIAADATRVADAQRAIAASKLKLDMFDRRMEVFSAVRTLISRVIAQSVATREEIDEYRLAILDAEFLFDHDLQEWAFDLHHAATENLMHSETISALIDDPDRGEEYQNAVDAQHRLFNRFTAELGEADGPSFRDRFRPFMTIEFQT